MQLGRYQAAMLTSRIIGFGRDSAILLFFGATAFSDVTFFLLGFLDLVNAVLVGGGTSLFVVTKLNDRHVVFEKIISSVFFFYFLLALTILCFEIILGPFLGKLLFSKFNELHNFKLPYYISISALCLSLPLISFFSIYIYIEKLYLQPLVNSLYTFVVCLGLYLIFFLENESFFLLSFVILVASVIRLLVCAFSIDNFFRFSCLRFTISKDPHFYKELFFSGISIGVLLALPFLFRAHLPSFGDGLYSKVAFMFKIGDLVQGMFVLPITLMLLKNNSLSNGKKIKILLSLYVVLFLSLLVLIQLINPTLSLVNSFFEMNAVIEMELLSNVIYSFLFSVLAYVLSMFLVQQGLVKVVTLAAFFSCTVFLTFQNFVNYVDLNTYFTLLYFTYALYLLVGILLMITRKAKSD